MSGASTAIVAKARAMYGRRLTKENYTELLRKQNVSEIVSYLKNQTAYGGVLSDINENLVHRGQLESVIRRQLYEEYTKLSHFNQKPGHGFMQFIVIKAEIEQILSCILNVSNDIYTVNFKLPVFFIKQLSFDIYKLFKAQSFEEILEVLDHTPYHKILKKYAAGFSQKDYTQIETDLHTYYFEQVFALMDRFVTHSARTELERLFLTMAEIENIVKITRLKAYFHYSAEQIKPYLLPFHRKLTQKDYDQMLNAQDAQEIFDFLKQSRYKKYFMKLEPAYYDKYIKQSRYRRSAQLMRFSRNYQSVFTAYMFLKEIEMKNIISIIEGIRYGAEPATIEKMLVFDAQFQN